jgi:hypothetical protein
MSAKMVRCKKCNYLVLAHKTKLNKRFKSDITYLDPRNNYKPTMVCPGCGEFLHKSVGLKFDYVTI